MAILDQLLPIRRILVDGEATPFVRDLDFSSAGFALTVDQVAGKLLVEANQTFGDGFLVRDENSNVALRVLNGVTEVQGDVINIATELNTTVNVGNGADTVNVTTNDLNLGADNILSLAAPAVRLGGAASTDRLTVSGAFSIITADVPDGTIFNLRSDVFGIYEAAQATPSFTFACDADAASSLTFGAGTTVSINQSQSLSGAGRALTVRGQQGQAGQAGGALILAGGLGGTSGTNAAGAVRIKLGTPVAGVTAPFYLEREDGTPVMTTYEIAAGIVGHYFGSAGGSHQGIVRGATLGLESSTGLIVVQPATDLYLGHQSNRDIFYRESGTTVLTKHLDADGETRLRFASGPTAIKIDHSQHASGAGVAMTVRAQQGASGQVGGNLELGSGLGGTAGTNAPGNIKLRVGAQAGGQTGHVLVTDESSGDTDFLRMRRVGTATYVESLAGDLNLSTTAAAQIIATTTMVFRGTSAFFDADTVYHRTNALASYWTEVKGTQTLSAATTVTIASYATTSGRVYGVEAYFTFSNDVDNQGGFLVYQASFRNVAGTVTQIESTVAVQKFRDAAVSGYDATIDFSGTTLRARFTPTDADSTVVKCVMRVYEVTLT